MHIGSPTRIESDGQSRLSARIDDFELWFDLPSAYGKMETADAFLAAALLPAMRSGSDITVDPKWPVSATLMAGIDQLQEIYVAWFDGFQKVNISATISDTFVPDPSVGSFFSGGVDSLYTFLRRKEEISHLIFLVGIDMQLDNHALIEEVTNRNTKFATDHGKTLVVVRSNIRDFCIGKFGVGWSHYYCGAGLGSFALLLGFDTVFVPASQPWVNLYPDGSSPIIEHKFSTRNTRLVYEGGAIRHEKIRHISEFDDAMRLLRVCWQDDGYNCGRCEKCLRTMLILRMFDLETPALPTLDDLSMLSDWRIRSEGEAFIFKNLERAAAASGNPEIVRYLARIRRRESFVRGIIGFDQRVLSGMGKRLWRRLRPLE